MSMKTVCADMLYNLYLIYLKQKLKGKDVFFSKNSRINTNNFFEGNNYIGGIIKDCRVGWGTYIMDQCRFDNCYIGRYCSIAEETKMVYKHGHPMKYVSTSPIFSSREAFVNTYLTEKNGKAYALDEYIEYEGKKWNAVIGNDVWIGTRAILLGAIKIGDGVVIGANTVVDKDIPPYAIVVGNPARIIGYRFERDQIDKLLKIKWWNEKEEWIKDKLNYFSDISLFLKKHGDDTNEK